MSAALYSLARRRLRAELAAEGHRPLVAASLRHVRLAQILEFVGDRATRRGEDAQSVCQRTAGLFAAGRLRITTDAASNEVTAVEEEGGASGPSS